MLRKLVALALSISLTFLAPPLHAASTKQEKTSEVSTGQGPRRHLAHIVFAGLAGAVLGLSSLSFYGRPQDRLSNIAVGFAIGVILGTAYTTYKAAAEPKDFYSARDANAQLWAIANPSRPDAFAQTPRSGLIFNF